MASAFHRWSRAFWMRERGVCFWIGGPENYVLGRITLVFRAQGGLRGFGCFGGRFRVKQGDKSADFGFGI